VLSQRGRAPTRRPLFDEATAKNHLTRRARRIRALRRLFVMNPAWFATLKSGVQFQRLARHNIRSSDRKGGRPGATHPQYRRFPARQGHSPQLPGRCLPNEPLMNTSASLTLVSTLYLACVWSGRTAPPRVKIHTPDRTSHKAAKPGPTKDPDPASGGANPRQHRHGGDSDQQ